MESFIKPSPELQKKISKQIEEGGEFALTEKEELELEKVTCLPTDFLSELSPKKKQLCSFSFPNVERIEDNVLLGCKGITSISFTKDLKITKKLQLVGDSFLAQSLNLTSLDLSGSCQFLTEIKDCFAQECNKLEKVNLAGLSRLTRIGDDFLYSCESLVSVNFAGVSNLLSTGNLFLASCPKLQAVDFSPCTKLKKFGGEFLAGGPFFALKSLILPPALEEVGWSFLYQTYSLEALDFSHLDCCRKEGAGLVVGDNFVSGSRLKKVTGLKIKEMGSYFLSDSNALEEFDLTALSSLEVIEEGCLFGRNATLKKLDLTPLQFCCKKISSEFLCTGTNRLAPDFQFRGLEALGRVEIEDEWLREKAKLPLQRNRALLAVHRIAVQNSKMGSMLGDIWAIRVITIQFLLQYE